MCALLILFAPQDDVFRGVLNLPGELLHAYCRSKVKSTFCLGFYLDVKNRLSCIGNGMSEGKLDWLRGEFREA